MLPKDATLQQSRLFLEHELRKRYSDREAASVSRLILEHVGYSSSTLLMEPSTRPGATILSQIKEIVAEINTGQPIQYILGYTYFFDLKIYVNKHVLIPRPETEEMVYKIKDSVDLHPDRVMDLGTGSGCIALALKKCYPGANVIGVEKSQTALKLAAENSKLHRLQIQWIEADLLHGVPGIPGQIDLIVSNPPYVRESERAMMDSRVLDFEPPQALFVSDSDPLVFYGAIASLGKEKLSPDGEVWVEINENLGLETSQIFQNAGFQQVTIMKDIHEKERFIRAASQRR